MRTAQIGPDLRLLWLRVPDLKNVMQNVMKNVIVAQSIPGVPILPWVFVILEKLQMPHVGAGRFVQQPHRGDFKTVCKCLTSRAGNSKISFSSILQCKAAAYVIFVAPTGQHPVFVLKAFENSICLEVYQFPVPVA